MEAFELEPDADDAGLKARNVGFEEFAEFALGFGV